MKAKEEEAETRQQMNHMISELGLKPGEQPNEGSKQDVISLESKGSTTDYKTWQKSPWEILKRPKLLQSYTDGEKSILADEIKLLETKKNDIPSDETRHLQIASRCQRCAELCTRHVNHPSFEACEEACAWLEKRTHALEADAIRQQKAGQASHYSVKNGMSLARAFLELGRMVLKGCAAQQARQRNLDSV
jgi:hypothetical protein